MDPLKRCSKLQQQLALINVKKKEDAKLKIYIKLATHSTIKTNIPDALSSSSERGSGRGGCGRPYTDMLVD